MRDSTSRISRSPNRLSRPCSSPSRERSCANEGVQGVDELSQVTATERLQLRPSSQASMTAFRALLLRDLQVLRKTLAQFAIRTVMQPLLLVFVFTYVFPKIGEGIGGSAGGPGAVFAPLHAGGG